MRIPKELQDQVRCMIVDGYRDAEISRAVGVSTPTVAKIRKPYGPYKPGRLYQLFSEDRKSMSAILVAEKHGCTRQTVYNILKGDSSDL